MKTLVIYAFHTINLNLEFFLQHGLFEHPEIDFYFGWNNLDSNLAFEPAIGTVIRRENRNFDFGAWGEILLTDNRYLQYDRYILLNSSVRGPFLPVWAQNQNWVELFTSRITDTVKLFGTMINHHGNFEPHVQSMVLTMDRIGIEIGIAAGIFTLGGPELDMAATILTREIGLSRAILESGYNIGCLLKIFDGIDFRRCKGLDESLHGFMTDDLYFGDPVHPYEVIFAKTPTKVLPIGKTTQLINRYTIWESKMVSSRQRKYEWDGMEYTLFHQDVYRAGIRTQFQTRGHFERHGKSEGRGFNADRRYYKIDLNPGRTSGLLNQIYSLINGILIGHYTDREIIVSDFYPDYNQDRRIPVGKIIDLDRLNLLLAKMNLKTYINDYHRLISGVKIGVDTCQPSIYINPTKEPYQTYGEYEVLRRLREETHWMVDLRDTFSDQIFRKNSEPMLAARFQRILTGITFTLPFQQEVTAIQTRFNLIPGKYSVVHLRLEDDSLAGYQSGLDRYLRYRNWMSQLLRPDEPIFIATHLTKARYQFNFVVEELKSQYPHLILRPALSEDFPYQGRDIDAIIEYLLCLDGKMCLGYNESTFSQGISYFYAKKNKPYHDLSSIPVPSSNQSLIGDGYTILRGHVGHGKIGIGGELGFDEHGLTRVIVPEMLGRQTISAHAPSSLYLKTDRELMISGYSHFTATVCPILNFRINRTPIGFCTAPGIQTSAIRLPPGEHKLTVATDNLTYAHSIWILDSV